jgi:hypothetical protein
MPLSFNFRRTGVLGIVLLLLAGFLLPSHAREFALRAESDGAPQLRLKVPATAEQRDWLSAHGFDVAGRDLEQQWVEVLTDTAGLDRLRQAGFVPELFDTRPGPRPLGIDPQSAYESHTDNPYTDPDELEAFLFQVVADHPSIARLESLGTSHQGRTIWGLMISDNAAVDEDELAILFSGAHHAREVMTPEVVMDTIDYLTDNYGTDSEITARVDAYQIWCVPMVNPDGVHRVFTADSYWRKNVRDNDGSGGIGDADGVDVNRNYDWGFGGQCRGSSGTESSPTYRGPFEGSEPETQAMIQLGRRILPVFDLEYHTYGEAVFYAMGCDDEMFSPTLSTIAGSEPYIGRVVAEEYASRLVTADGGIGFWSAPSASPVDGLGRDHQYHETGAVAFVTEMNDEGQGGFGPDYTLWRDATVIGQRPGWLWLIDRMAGPAVGGHVLDAVTGQPVVADVGLDELSLPDGKRLTARPETGRFHIVVVPGAYTLRVSAPGYAQAIVPVDVGEAWQPIQVELQPLGSSRIAFEDFEDVVRVVQWTAGEPTDDAFDGIWEWGEPYGTHVGDVQGGDLDFGAPALDRTPGSGARAFVTGNQASATIYEDDVDGGATTLTSPPYDLSEWYAVEVSWQRWFQKEPDPLDVLTAEVSADGGQSWAILEVLDQPTSGADAEHSWAPVTVRLDERVPIGDDVRLRFQAIDVSPDNMVEAAIDELEIRGFSRASFGVPTEVRMLGEGGDSLEWEPVPGAPDAVYDIVRGDVINLASSGESVDLGSLTCIESDSTDTATGTAMEADEPPVGTTWFYVVRFELGFSIGGWGASSNGAPREGVGGCGN